MYISLTMGNIVDTKREVFEQMLDSLPRFHTLDIRWKVWKD